eukprot:COSAG04_NODE_15936_length_515_cov_0.877404_1_plen_134_part_01
MRRFAGLAITAGLAAAVPERRQGGARWCVGEPLEEDEVSSPAVPSFLAGSSLARCDGEGLNAAAAAGGSRPGMILTEPLAGVQGGVRARGGAGFRGAFRDMTLWVERREERLHRCEVFGRHEHGNDGLWVIEYD